MESRTLTPVWIVLPVYRDVESFLELKKTLPPARCLVVDDSGGLDPSVETLKQNNDVDVVTCPFNLGPQRAIVYGLRHLLPQLRDDDVVVTMDSDGQDKPEDVPRLIQRLSENPDKIVLAERTIRPEGWSFRLFYFFFRIAFRVLTGRVIRNGSFAAFRAKFAKKFVFHPSFDLCYASTLISLGLPLVQEPCERGQRSFGESRMSRLKLFRHGLAMMTPFLDEIATRSLLFFFGIFAAGAFLSFTVLGVRLFTNLAIPGWATYTLLLIVILSVGALSNFILFFMLFSQSLRMLSPFAPVNDSAGKAPR